MAIHTIRNNTGAQLELWDAGNLLANLANGASINTLPITITSVTRNEVQYHKRVGVFVNNDSYLATHAGASVIFTGSGSTVTFT